MKRNEGGESEKKNAREREREKRRFSQHVSHWRLSVPPLIRDSTKNVRARQREREREWRERVHSRYPQSRPLPLDFPTLCKRHLSFETPSSLRLWLVKGLPECFPTTFYPSNTRPQSASFIRGSEKIVKTDRQPYNQPAFHWMEYRQPIPFALTSLPPPFAFFPSPLFLHSSK